MAMVNIKSKEIIQEEEFSSEKELQKQVQDNLKSLLNVEFIQTEFSTSNGGRMDTLGLDIETGAPVIIEYKFDKSKEIINQLIFYYEWLLDHKDTFNRIVAEKLKTKIEVNWAEDVRLICIAKDFTDWDYSLIKHLNIPIELYKYTFFSNCNFSLQQINEINKIKQISTDNNTVYDYEHQRNKCNEQTQKILDEIRDKILNMEKDIEENIKKYYVGFKSSVQNFVWLHPQRQKIKIHMRVLPNDFDDPKKIARDIPEQYLWGKNIKEFQVSSESEIEYAVKLIKQAYESTHKK